MRRAIWILGLGVATSTGCNQPGSGDGAGGNGRMGTSAGTHVEMSASTSATGEVAACEASVDVVRAACAAEDPASNRLCLYDALKPLCTTGRTAFMKTIFDCLAADTCQSPGDPSSVKDCVETAMHAAETPGDQALAAAVCACKAPTAPDVCLATESLWLPNAMLLSTAEAAVVTSCLTTKGCAQQNACFDASSLQAALACP